MPTLQIKSEDALWKETVQPVSSAIVPYWHCDVTITHPIKCTWVLKVDLIFEAHTTINFF